MQKLPELEDVRRLIDAGLGSAPTNSPEHILLLVDRGFLLSQREDRRDEVAEAAVSEAAIAAEQLGDADLLSAALDLVQSWELDHGRYGEAYRTTLKRNDLVPVMTDATEIGDSHAMAARTAHHLGRYREAEAHASACIERSRGVDAGSYLHGLTCRIMARFVLGEWEGTLADQAELERVAAQDPRELPVGFTVRAYAYAALCRELRGEDGEADRYLELARRYFAHRPVPDGRLLHAPPLALVLARRGRFDEALALIPLVPCSASAGLTLEARCEIAAASGRWDEAADLVTATREESDNGELLSLPLFADRLEGRAASAEGDVPRAVELLGRSAEGFAALGAPWEEAWSRLLLAESVAGSDRQRAERELAAALPLFEQLGSVREVDRARALLQDAPAKAS
jgi:hypothetical protein